MTINGIDTLAEFGVEEWNVEPGYCSVSNISEWPSGWNVPYMSQSVVGLKTLNVSVMIRGQRRSDIWEAGSRFVGTLIRPCTIKLRDFDNNFFLVLKNASQAETALRRWHKATLELVGYEFADLVTVNFSGKSSLAHYIHNMGSLVTPCTIIFTPTANMNQLTVTGLVRDRFTGEDKPIVINKMTKNVPLTIDALNGKVTQNGENCFGDVELYDWPSLLPGENPITVSESVANIELQFYPLFI